MKNNRNSYLPTKWEIIKGIAVVILFLAVILGLNAYMSRVQYDAELDGQEMKVSWTELNFRAEPDGEIICVLHRGNLVTLTGNYRTTGSGDSKTEQSWVECTLMTTGGVEITGWVARGGLDWGW